MVCVAGANPSPSYVWTNAAGRIETHGRFLSVQNVDELDDRNYTHTCTATNILGFDKHSVLIKFTSRFHQYFNILIEKKEWKSLEGSPKVIILLHFQYLVFSYGSL